MCPSRLVCDILLKDQCFPLSELGETLFYIFHDLEVMSALLNVLVMLCIRNSKRLTTFENQRHAG